MTLSPAGNFFSALYHKLQTQSSAPEDGRNYRPKHVELIEIINKLLLLNVIGCLYYCIRDAVTQTSNRRTEFRQVPMHTSSTRNDVLHHVTLMKLSVARCVGAKSFLIRHSNGHTK